MKKYLLPVTTFFFTYFFLFSQKVFAATKKTGIFPSKIGQWTSLKQAIKAIADIVFIVAGVIFLIMLLIGGIQYLAASGNEEAAGKAKKTLLNSVIGLVIVALAWVVSHWLIKSLLGSGYTT